MAETRSAWTLQRTRSRFTRTWIEKMLPKAPEVGEALSNGGRLLDVGCGPGLLLLQLAELYPVAGFTGIDIVEVGGLNTARRLVKERGLEGRITVELMKAEEMFFHDAFDCVVITSVYHEFLPVELRESVIRGCYRALKRRGVLTNRDMVYPSTLEELRDPIYQVGVYGQYSEMAWGTIVPTREERYEILKKAGFIEIQSHVVGGIPQGAHYLNVARKSCWLER